MKSLIKGFAVFVSLLLPNSSLALELRASDAEISCIAKNSAEIENITSAILILVPAFCPANPFIKFDVEVLTQNNTDQVRRVLVLSKTRAKCIAQSATELVASRANSGNSDVRSRRFDC